MPSKKSSKSNSKVRLGEEEVRPERAIFEIFAMMGVAKSPQDIRVNYEDEGGHVSIALPKIKFAVAFEGDDPSPLSEKGYHVVHLSAWELSGFAAAFAKITSATVAQVYARADPNVKTTSEPEEKIFSEIARRGLMIPDRNYTFRRDDGSELTTPDFTWEKYQVAFFMDGSYWHSVKQDREIIKELKKSRKLGKNIETARKDKVRKDGKIRSELSSMGWSVISCTDEDVEEQDGVREVVDMIERTLSQAESTLQYRAYSGGEEVDEESRSVLDDLLGS